MPLLSNIPVLFVVSVFLLLMCELYYFRIADKFNIIDKPNNRSSHAIPTIRGGGIVFIVALLFWFFLFEFTFPFMVAGACLIAFISFLDDIKEQPPLVRSGLQLISLLLLLWQVNFFNEHILLVSVAIIVVVGAVNAFNFMDGINGITGVYALFNLTTFWYVNKFVAAFTSESLIIIVLSGVFVFLFFNFRMKARCFAGDVGSVTLAYIQIFLLLQLIVETNHYGWVLMVLVFGIDSVVTIGYRLSRGDNIFKPHRTHLYQYLCNELQYSHLLVSLLYGIVQLLINGLIIYSFVSSGDILLLVVVGVVYSLIYLLLRVKVQTGLRF